MSTDDPKSSDDARDPDPPEAPDGEEDPDEDEEDGEPSEPPPAPKDAPSSTGARPPLIAERTLRGLGVALGCAALVLVHYHVARPWFAEHHVQTFVPEDVATALKAAVAFTAFGLSLWALVRRLAGKPFTKKVMTLATVAFGVMGVIGYVGSDDLGATNFIHKWEFFHYYLGSKYPRELSYKRIYVCTAVAQAELGPEQRAEVMARKIRNLDTDVIEEAGPVLSHPEDCKSHFTHERWKEFRKDVAWFRFNSNKGFWEGMQTDHGYNPPPVWTMSGHLFGGFFPEATTASLRVLASLDTLVFALTFFFVWWAFGLEICCVALLFWGTQFPANGYFTGGAFLRQDWLLFLVLAACLLRKRYFALAGASLAASALLRVFPAIFFAGIALVTLVHLYEKRRFKREHLRVFGGAAIATAVLVSGSVVVAGPRAYTDFQEHIALHHRTPLTNNMGLGMLLSFSEAGRAEVTRDKRLLDEFSKWADMHSASLERRRPSYLAINGFFLVVFFLTVRRIKSLWIAMGLSTLLVVSIPTLTCYYYSFFLVPVLLSKVSPRILRMCLFAAGLSALVVIWPRVSFQWDDRFTTQSLLFLVFPLVLLLGFLRDPPDRAKIAAAKVSATTP